MTDEDGTDQDLRARFARLREEERAPGEGYARFAARTAATARPRERPRRWSVVPALAAAAAMVVLALLLRGGPGGAPPPAAGGLDLSATSLRMPTDFLLATPGSELLRSVPAFGGPGFTAAPGATHTPGTPRLPERQS